MRDTISKEFSSQKLTIFILTGEEYGGLVGIYGLKPIQTISPMQNYEKDFEIKQFPILFVMP